MAFGLMDKDTIIIKAPVGTKARWVRQSQREGKKLSDWIQERITMSNKAITLVIPAGLDFAELKRLGDEYSKISYSYAMRATLFIREHIEDYPLYDNPGDGLPLGYAAFQ